MDTYTCTYKYCYIIRWDDFFFFFQEKRKKNIGMCFLSKLMYHFREANWTIPSDRNLGVPSRFIIADTIRRWNFLMYRASGRPGSFIKRDNYRKYDAGKSETRRKNSAACTRGSSSRRTKRFIFRTAASTNYPTQRTPESPVRRKGLCLETNNSRLSWRTRLEGNRENYRTNVSRFVPSVREICFRKKNIPQKHSPGGFRSWSGSVRRL